MQGNNIDDRWWGCWKRNILS